MSQLSAPQSPQPVSRLSLHDEIVVRLRDMILEGALAPGSAIPELKLCEDLEISRTPLREALKVLAAEELVTLLPNRGAVVREIVPEEIAEIFEITEALEGLIGRLVVARASDQDIEALERLHLQLVALKTAGDRHGYFDLNQAIHRRISELSGNRTLAAGYANYVNKIRRARYLANQTSTRWSESVEEHAAFMAALCVRDGEAFAALLQQHMRRTGEAVVASLKALPDPKPATRRRR